MGNVMYGKTEPTKKRVWYSGTDTLYEGYNLCYDSDSITADGFNAADTAITAATSSLARNRVVEKPSQGNCNSYAGVVAPECDGFVGPGEITIIPPGNVANVRMKLNCTINATYGTVTAGSYDMEGTGYWGEGTAKAIQTINRSSTAGLVQAELMVGVPSGGYESISAAAVTVGGAQTFMPYGVTVFNNAATPASDVTYSLTAGQFIGQKKLFSCGATMTTNDIVITATRSIVTAGVPAAAASKYYELDAAAEYAEFRWNGTAWVAESTGTVES